MKRPLLSMIALGLLAASTARAGDQRWTRFRGPNGAGISNATAIPVTWTEKDYNWKVKLPGAGHSSPVVWGQRVFVTGADADTAKRIVVCIDAADGHTLWQRDYPAKTRRQHRENDYASTTPAVDADGLIVTWSSPEEVVLLALSLEGRELWRRNLGPFVTVQGDGSSPILFGDLAILADDQEDPNLLPSRRKAPREPPGKSAVIAVDRKTGHTRWRTERKTTFAAYSTPCAYQAEDGRQELIFTNTAHGITALDPATGKVNWEFGPPFLDRAISSPVVAPGLVIAGHGAGNRAQRYIAVRPGSLSKGRAPALAYELTKTIPLIPTPIVKDDRLYLWTDDGVAACHKLSNGELVWRERVGGAFYASPVWVNGRLYCVSKKGEVVVLAAGDKFQVLARVELGEPSFATPAVADGVMYLRTRSQLFSLGGQARRPAAKVYVPEPQPVRTKILIGAHHCPLWEADKPAMWDQVVKHPERTPALGFYSQENPEVADWETKFAVDHGVGFFVYCWYRDGQGGPVKMRFGTAIHDALFKSRYVSKMQFTIMWENQARGRAGVAGENDLLENLLPFWMSNYFRHPSYLKIDNRPLLFIYRPEFLVQDLGGVDKVRAALDKMRAACRAAGFDGLYVLGEYRGLDPKHLRLMKSLGLDYTFAYCWPVKDNPLPQQAIAAQLASIVRTRELGVLPEVVTVSQGWSGWHDEGSIWRIPPAEYKELLRRAKQIVESFPAAELGSKLLLLDNWNEWSEGHYIAPHREHGFGYLDAVREVFADAPAEHTDVLPSQIGMGPYDQAYQRHVKAGYRPKR